MQFPYQVWDDNVAIAGTMLELDALEIRDLFQKEYTMSLRIYSEISREFLTADEGECEAAREYIAERRPVMSAP